MRGSTAFLLLTDKPHLNESFGVEIEGQTFLVRVVALDSIGSPDGDFDLSKSSDISVIADGRRMNPAENVNAKTIATLCLRALKCKGKTKCGADCRNRTMHESGLCWRHVDERQRLSAEQ